jgi:signal transduction histidine kinase
MKQLWRWRKIVVNKMAEHPWLLLLLLAAAALTFEILENWDIHNPVDVNFVREVLFFGAIYPVVTFWLLNRLLAARAKHHNIAWQQERSRQLKQKMMQATNIEEVYQIIAAFPETIAPVVGVILFRPSADGTALKMAVERWPVHGQRPPSLPPTISYHYCGAAAHSPDSGLHPFVTSPVIEDTALHGYCLPLFHANQEPDILHLYLPSLRNLTSDQIAILNQTALAMALALGSAEAANVEMLQAVAARDERKRIARHLHDTLGQKLAYLQLKLTNFTTDDVLSNISSIQHDLERMRDIANEAYGQVRQTLLTMQVEENVDLAKALLAQAETTSKLAHFRLRPFIDGCPRPLAPLAQRKILFIFREALNNIQRHAQATAVDLSITWHPDTLCVSLRDDGSGFNTQNGHSNGHFGLLIMAQRAEEINSTLTITSAPRQGTYVTLRYPLS